MAQDTDKYPKQILMKKMAFSIIALSLSLAVSAQTTLTSLTGKWISDDGGGMEIIDATRAFMIYGTERKRISSLKLDCSTRPCYFDFVIADSTSTTVGGLLQFMDANTIQWQVFDDPVNRKGVHEAIVLKRKK